MKSQKKRDVAVSSALILILIIIFMGNVQPDVGNPKVSKVVFFVS